MRLTTAFLVGIAIAAMSSPVLAERELHVVSVQEGWTIPGDYQNEPQANVVVDRPGKDVVLVLLDPGQVDWMVATTNGSFIETVILGGHTSRSSRVYLNGVPFPLDVNAILPVVRQPLGSRFRRFLNDVSAETGLSRIASFQSAHTARRSGYLVAETDPTTETLAVDYLAGHLKGTKDLPSTLELWAAAPSSAADTVIEFDTSGMTLSDTQGTRSFPLPTDMPPPVLPSGAFFDTQNNRLYGISYGGDGFLYQVDALTGRWSILANLEGYDGAEVFYDPHSNQFILTGAFSRPGEIRVIKQDGSAETTKIEVRRFPGLTDLYDFPNEQAPSLIPRAFEANWLLADARNPGLGMYRLYAVNLVSEEVRLVAYENTFDPRNK